MGKVYSDIDEAAEEDVRLFWKLTKRSLYSPLEDAHFDTDFNKRMEDRFQHLIDECTTVTFQEAKFL